MSKITLNNVGSLIDATTAAATINANNATIQTAIDNTLSRDGTSPNTMSDTLDMNSNQIVNLPAPATDNSPLRLQDLDTFIGGGTITNIPSGGNTGDRLIKSSNANYAVAWGSESSDLTAGTNITITGTSPATISLVTAPTTLGTNITGTASGLTAGHVTTNANLTGDITSTGNATTLATVATAGTTGSSTAIPVVTINAKGLTTGITTAAVVAPAGTLSGATLNSGVTASSLTSFGASPTLVTPLLGTPTSGVLTNCTGTASGLTAGNVTTNANLTGVITSSGNATFIASQTGTGTQFVTAAGSPTFTGTPATPTAAVDTNTTQIASTAFVLAQAASATPIIDGSATVGTSTRYARGDHIHPTDTTRAPTASPTFTGTLTAATVTASGPTTLTNSTASTTTSTGALIVTGGAGVGGDLNWVGAAQTAWTPTVTASTGSITSYTVTTAQYKKFGKMVVFNIEVVITNAGTGSNTLNITMPSTTSGVFTASGREGVLTGSSLAITTVNSTTLGVRTYNNLTVVTTNADVTLGGFYFE